MALWRVRTDVRLRKIAWDEELVVYNASVGHTHVLNPPVHAIIERMTSGFVPVEELCAVYRDALPEALRDEPASPETIVSLLRELARFGMVEQKPE